MKTKYLTTLIIIVLATILNQSIVSAQVGLKRNTPSLTLIFSDVFVQLPMLDPNQATIPVPPDTGAPDGRTPGGTRASQGN